VVSAPKFKIIDRARLGCYPKEVVSPVYAEQTARLKQIAGGTVANESFAMPEPLLPPTPVDRCGRLAAPQVGSRLSPAGGVAIDGVDLSQPLSRAAKALIHDAFLAHHVVVFPNQALSREQQFSFAAAFGDVERSAGSSSQTKRHGVAHILSNLDQDGRPVDRSSSPLSNYRWHTDKPYFRVPPMMTSLYAVELPPDGGDTEFANTAMAYAELPPETKQQIASLRVVFCHGGGGDLSIPPGPDREEVDHPLVRTHPGTGRKALYLGNHASHLLGLPAAEGRALLQRLLAHATEPQFVYRHRWRIGDLVIWDNRCLLHRVVANFDANRHRRILHRSVVRGTLPV
jgi:alpha-ketoglutarate-dependent taurine dioxygenase